MNFDHSYSKEVFAFQTNLRRYSTNWNEVVFPEGEALKKLCQFAYLHSGHDLFGSIIKPGDHVVIKPNLVRDWHPDGQYLYAVITHPAVIRAVVDQVYQALQGEGKITIADAPMGDTDFDHLLSVTRLEQIADFYRKHHDFSIDILDLRQYRYTFQPRPGGYGHEVRSDNSGDVTGYYFVDLGSESTYSHIPGQHLLEGTDVSRRKETIASHREDANRYLIARTALDADVIVSIPKLKVHSKVGVTLNCKNMVGINGDKNLLPHFRWGSPSEGGDQFPTNSQNILDKQRMRLGRFVADTFLARQTKWANRALDVVQSISGLIARGLSFKPVEPVNGDWPGNDTCWRLAADLIRVSVFADRNGILHNTPQRRFLSIIDGIVGGEGNGPLRATPKSCGVLIAGTHPIATDLVGTHLMGFDYRKIRYLNELADGDAAYMQPGFGTILPEHITVHTNITAWEALFQKTEGLLNFISPPRWEGAIELYSEKKVVTPFLAQEV